MCEYCGHCVGATRLGQPVKSRLEEAISFYCAAMSPMKLLGRRPNWTGRKPEWCPLEGKR